MLPGQDYEARFVANDAGTFWFHHHVNAEEQIERGLYAPFIVHEAEAPSAHADRTFILDDVKLEATGKLSTTTDALDVMSPQSPLGSALLGKAEGDVVEYQAPNGVLKVRVLEVEAVG